MPLPAPYDFKLTLKAAGKVAALAAAGVLIADTTGLSQFLLTQIPAQYQAGGAVLVSAVLAAIKNYVSNAGRPLA